MGEAAEAIEQPGDQAKPSGQSYKAGDDAAGHAAQQLSPIDRGSSRGDWIAWTGGGKSMLCVGQSSRHLPIRHPTCHHECEEECALSHDDLVPWRRSRFPRDVGENHRSRNSGHMGSLHLDPWCISELYPESQAGVGFALELPSDCDDGATLVVDPCASITLTRVLDRRPARRRLRESQLPAEVPAEGATQALNHRKSSRWPLEQHVVRAGLASSRGSDEDPYDDGEGQHYEERPVSVCSHADSSRLSKVSEEFDAYYQDLHSLIPRQRQVCPI